MEDSAVSPDIFGATMSSLPEAFTHFFINIEKEPKAAGAVEQSTRS